MLNSKCQLKDLTYSCKLRVQANGQKHEEEQNRPQWRNRKLGQSIWISNECQAKSCTKTKKSKIRGHLAVFHIFTKNAHVMCLSDLPSPLHWQAFCRCEPYDPRLKIWQSLQAHWYLRREENSEIIKWKDSWCSRFSFVTLHFSFFQINYNQGTMMSKILFWTVLVSFAVSNLGTDNQLCVQVSILSLFLHIFHFTL